MADMVKLHFFFLCIIFETMDEGVHLNLKQIPTENAILQ